MTYLTHLLVLVGIYALLAASLNLTAGLLGLVSICQAAFFGVGAYAAAVLLSGHSTSGAVVLAAALLLGWIVGAIVALPLLRLKGDYFAIATFAFQAIATAGFYNLPGLTGGAPGVAGIGALSFGPLRLSSACQTLVLVFTALLALLLVQLAWRRSPAGRVLATIYEDEISVVTLGLNPVRYRVGLFAVGAGVAAFAGAIYASYMTFVDPTLFAVGESIMVLCAVIIGGPGGLAGPVVGAAALVLLPEGLRFIGLPAAAAANLRQIIFGVALILVMMFVRPAFSGRSGVETGAGSDA